MSRFCSGTSGSPDKRGRTERHMDSDRDKGSKNPLPNIPAPVLDLDIPFHIPLSDSELQVGRLCLFYLKFRPNTLYSGSVLCIRPLSKYNHILAHIYCLSINFYLYPFYTLVYVLFSAEWPSYARTYRNIFLWFDIFLFDGMPDTFALLIPVAQPLMYCRGL